MSEPGGEPAARRTRWQMVRNIAPWVLGLLIVAIVAMRIPYDQFRAAIVQGPQLEIAAINLGIIVLTLVTDAFAAWTGLVAVHARRPLREVAVVRGAMFILFLLNYAVGQGGFGVYLHRSGIPTMRAVGITLFVMGTTLATMLLVTILGWSLHGVDAANLTLWRTFEVLTAAFVAYLVVILLAPRWLAQRPVFAPLFDAGLRGHALSIVGRLPHSAVMVFGHWAALRAWGIPVPVASAVTFMPAVAVISTLPISPAGLGTTQAAFVYFFSVYASSPVVLAFAIVHFVYGVLASLLVGAFCVPFARRIQRDGALTPG